MKKQELHPNCPFAPSQMVADADLPDPIAQGKWQNRGVNHCEGEKSLPMVGAMLWVAKPRTAESQRAW